MWGYSEPADSYYEVRPECKDVPKTKFKIKSGKTLSVRKWRTAFSPEGQLDLSKTLGRIQRGGIHPSIRGEVWEFLLGCYDPKSTYDEREEIRQLRRTKYARWKEVCHEIFPVVGSGRFITAPVITEDGQPIKDPLVVLETSQNKALDETSQDKALDETSEDKASDETSEDEALDETSQDKVLDDSSEDEALDETSQDKALDETGAEKALDETGEEKALDESSEDEALDETSQDKDLKEMSEEKTLDETNENKAINSAPSNVNMIASTSELVKELTSHGPLDKKVIQWLLTLHQIGLDVVRTDRTLVFYEKQENLSKLWDILAVYAWIDTDVGYCQGMSDLCSPMIMLLEDEADAFWCFERLMHRLRGNFRCTESSVGVETQLSNLASITQVIDPKLHQHLDALGGGDYLFAFRMLMVLFRREFSFCDSLYLWEMMWALEYDPDLFGMYEEAESGEKAEGSKRAKSFRQYGKFERENMKNGAEAPLPISVFLVASVLKDKSSKLLTEARGLDDVVKILNDMTGNLDAKKACTGAMKLHKKYLKKAKKT